MKKPFFKVVLSARADREFGKLPEKLQQKLFDEFKKLSSDPFTLRNIKKVRGTDFGYRLRIWRWRILFVLFSKEKRIEIVDIFLKKGDKDYTQRRKLLR